ncbi:methylmalonyl-CoA mutase subunit beta [Hyunsoonleella sp. 2307UL5-6]|uniref:methylmalonyl-CoA mutase subunit beta n=1 Tax=Hyunsoonleella sp. 2307UL5-6 TaxID=3384768 RepID=UPI0039BD4E1F
MSNSLFNEFEPVSAKQWKQIIQFDLKGADYNDALVWTSSEGIKVKPFYHSDDLNTPLKLSETPISSFKICETLTVFNAKKANASALLAVKKGAESIRFIIPSKDIDFKKLLANINFKTITLYFELQFLSEDSIKSICAITSKVNTFINIDIIGHLAKTGNWYSNLNDDFSKFKTCTLYSNSLTINASLYQNAGANMVQQLAYAIAHVNEYFNAIETTHTSISSQINIVFNVAIGTNYFFEIAKLRALRVLFNTLKKEYSTDYKCIIFATPSTRNKALYAYNTNMLRTTTECMSAVLGSADTISNLPYDTVFNKPNDFACRIARNQLLILKHESYFDVVKNPSDGSYYIESLTQQLANKALDIFKDIETNGGFLKQLKSGTIQRKIKESATKEQEQFNAGNKVILGSNKHPNTSETMKSNLEIYPFVKTKKRKTLIEPIIEKRLTEHLEQKRLKTE